MKILKIILYSILFFGLISIFTIVIVGMFINKLSDNNSLKKWWRRNIIDRDPNDQ